MKFYLSLESVQRSSDASSGADIVPLDFSTNTYSEFSAMVALSNQGAYMFAPSMQRGYMVPPSVQGGYMVPPVQGGYLIPPSIQRGYMVPPSVQGGFTSLLAGIHQDASAVRKLHFDEVSNPTTFE
ncbi:hypothetical protein SEVIR_9G401650v4 [Setaria viridis]